MRSLNRAMIAMTGTGGTGKSTVMEEIHRITGLRKLPSVARACQEKVGITEAEQFDLSPERLWELQRAIFTAKDDLDREAAKASYDTREVGCVSDRSLVCSLAYTFQRSARFMDQETIQNWVRRTREDVRRFDVLAYFPYPPKHDVPHDGFRLDSPGLLAGHDMLIRTIVRDLEREGQLQRGTFASATKLVIVLPGTPTERALQILAAVRG